MGIGAKCYFRAKSPLFDASSQYKCVTHLPGQTAQFVREFAKCEMSSIASIINHELAGHSVERAPRPLLAKNESERIQCGSSVFLFLCLRKSGNKEPRGNKKKQSSKRKRSSAAVAARMQNVECCAHGSLFMISHISNHAHRPSLLAKNIASVCVCVLSKDEKVPRTPTHAHTYTLKPWLYTRFCFSAARALFCIGLLVALRQTFFQLLPCKLAFLWF